MKKNNFKKILVVFSLCVFLLSMFSVSSFALNISDVHTGYVYEFTGSLSIAGSLGGAGPVNVSGYVVDKSSGNLTAFNSLHYNFLEDPNVQNSYRGILGTGSSSPVDRDIVNPVSSSYGKIYIDFANNSMSKSDFESFLNVRFTYTVTRLDYVGSMFDKANIALVGGTNDDGSSFDGLLGMISKFAKSLVSTPLLLVLCIALPLVSFSVGLIIRIKNRA